MGGAGDPAAQAPRPRQGGDGFFIGKGERPKADSGEEKPALTSALTGRRREPTTRGPPLASEPMPKKAISSESEKMRKIFQMLRWHPLEPSYGGGIPYVINLFFHLWAVDEVYDRAMLGVHIPDTIIVQKGRPEHWFYTEEKTTRLRAKEEELVKDKSLCLAALTRRGGVSQQASNVAAMFIPTPTKDTRHAQVSYLGLKELKELFALDIMPDGLFQRFIAPVGRYNVHLQAKCGKGRSLSLERFQSLLRVTDRLMGNNDSSGDDSVSVTWESAPVQANPLFAKRIERITSGMLRNLTEISEGHDPTERMQSLTLQFKNDTEGKLWLLWLSDIEWKDDGGETMQSKKREKMNKMAAGALRKVTTMKRISASAAAASGDGSETTSGAAAEEEEGEGGDGDAAPADGQVEGIGEQEEVAPEKPLTKRKGLSKDASKQNNISKKKNIVITVPEEDKLKTPAEVAVGNRLDCFMMETTVSRSSKVRSAWKTPAAASFAGKQKGEALRFGVMMQVSQRSRREAAEAARARLAARAAAGEGREDGGEVGDAQLSRALTGKLVVSSKKQSKRKAQGSDEGTRPSELYRLGTHVVTLPHIKSSRSNPGAVMPKAVKTS